MSKIVDLIESKDLVTAKSLFSEKIESFKKLKLLEMKKIVAAKLYENKVLDATLKEIDRVFGPGGEFSHSAVKKRVNAARMNDPGFQKWLKKKGKNNPYKENKE